MPEETDALVRTCRDELALPVRGLMCIPPIDEEPSLHFALLREIARRNGLNELSMGMSGDFEVAVRFGATHVRIGTAIFGARLGGRARLAIARLIRHRRRSDRPAGRRAAAPRDRRDASRCSPRSARSRGGRRAGRWRCRDPVRPDRRCSRPPR